MSRRVNGEGPCPNDVLILGEAPSWQELRQGRPFIGPTGQEFNNYLNMNRLARGRFRIDNVIPYFIDKKDKSTDRAMWGLVDTYKDSYNLILERVRPSKIITLGQLACMMVLGRKVDLEMEHGIPVLFDGRAVLPCYHPAAGLHQTRNMTRIMKDFSVFSKFTSGWIPSYEDTPEVYSRNRCMSSVDFGSADYVAVDTETTRTHPYMIQVGFGDGVAHASLTKEDDLRQLKYELERRHVVFHNAKFDLQVLRLLGIYPQHYADTMVMAYLLGDEPQSLKRLAYRHLGIRMKTFNELLAPIRNEMALDYCDRILSNVWPDPEPVREWNPKPKMEWVYREERILCTKRKRGAIEDEDGYYYIKKTRDKQVVVRGTENGHYRYRQGQNIATKVKKLVNKDSSEYDVLDALVRMEGTEILLDKLELLPQPSIADVPLDEAIYYGCMDADVTHRIYPILRQRMREEGLC